MININLTKKKLIQDLLNISKKNHHYIVGEPFNIYLFDVEPSFILDNYSLSHIKTMIQMNSDPYVYTNEEDEELSSLDSQSDNELDEEIIITPDSEKLDTISAIMQIIKSKNIGTVGESYNIDFEVDNEEDLFDSFSLIQLKNVLGLVSKMDNQTNEDTDYIDVLSIVERYKDGAIEIDLPQEKIWWRTKTPSNLIKIMPSDTINTVYEKAKNVRDSFSRNSPQYIKIYDYMHDLSEIMYPSPQNEVDGNDDFDDTDDAQYVRMAVEAIILPYHEALEKLEKSGGKILYGNLWNTHFSEGLKNDVKKRDGWKCVVCFEERNLHVHHKIPRKLGGIHHIHNLVTLCSSCHPIIETGDLERAFKKCLSNHLQHKLFLQHPVNLDKNILVLKQEVTNSLENLMFTFEHQNEQLLLNEVISILKKIEYIFDN